MGVKKELGNFCKNCKTDTEKKDAKFCNAKCCGEWKKSNNPILKDWLNGSNPDPDSVNVAMRRYLLQQVDNKCSKCNWNVVNIHTGKIPLEIDHIDGNHGNNDINNLQVLCPNCHSLTSTYKGANKKPGRQWRKKYSSDIATIKRIKENNKIENLIADIVEANIDFTKFGWCTKVSEILQITPQKVRSWINKHMPELSDVLFTKL